MSMIIDVYSTKLEVISLSVGCSMIASSLIAYLSAEYLLKNNQYVELLEKWGLDGIYETRAETNKSPSENFKNIQKRLDLIAFGLRSFRNTQGEFVRQNIQRGLKIRILTINPNSIFVAQREKDERAVEGEISKSIFDLGDWVLALQSDYPKFADNIQLKFYDALPLDFFMCQDKYIYVGPFLHGKLSQQTISYRFRAPSMGYYYWDRYFESLWDDENFAKLEY